MSQLGTKPRPPYDLFMYLVASLVGFPVTSKCCPVCQQRLLDRHMYAMIFCSVLWSVFEAIGAHVHFPAGGCTFGTHAKCCKHVGRHRISLISASSLIFFSSNPFKFRNLSFDQLSNKNVRPVGALTGLSPRRLDARLSNSTPCSPLAASVNFISEQTSSLIIPSTFPSENRNSN